MTKNLSCLVLISLLFSACQSMDAEGTAISIAGSPPTSTPAPARVETTPTPSTGPTAITPTPMVTASPACKPTSTQSVTPFPIIQPVVHEQPGDIYETIFSIPEGQEGIIQYYEGGTEILGPRAIATLPDDSFLIADNTLYINRLLHFDQDGRLLNTMELNDLGISSTIDLRRKGQEIVLLERPSGPRRGYRVQHLSLDGALIATEEIPYEWPLEEGPPPTIGQPLTLGNSLTGIAIDCDGDVLLEAAGEIIGGYTLRLMDVLNNPGPSEIPNGYPCNDKLYRPVAAASRMMGDFKAGDVTYETELTNNWGALGLLEVFPDGRLYLARLDSVNGGGTQFDQTVHFINGNGEIQGMARIPHSEFYYRFTRKMTINSKGEVFVLLPRPDSVDVVRLNFYKKLEPLIPGAVAPNLALRASNP